MKALTCSAFAICILCCIRGNAQENLTAARKLLFLKNHLSAGFAFPVTFSKQESHTGLGNFHMRTLPGFALHMEYTYNFTPNFAMSAGTQAGIKNLGYHVSAPGDDFGLPKTMGKNFMLTLPFFSVPFMFTPRIFISKRHILQADVGGSMTLFFPAGSGSTLNYLDHGAPRRVFEMKLAYNKAPLFMLHTGISYSIVLKSANIFKISCTMDYGTAKAVRGSYTFFGDDMKVGYGRMYSSLSSVALGISYVFTRAAGLQKS